MGVGGTGRLRVNLERRQATGPHHSVRVGNSVFGFQPQMAGERERAEPAYHHSQVCRCLPLPPQLSFLPPPPAPPQHTTHVTSAARAPGIPHHQHRAQGL